MSRKRRDPVDDGPPANDRITTEVRWILPAEAGPDLVELRDDRPIEERVDTYLVPASPSRWSVKRRGPHGVLEAKRRIGPAEPVRLRGGAHGRAQRWRRLPAVDHLEGTPIDVGKRRWRRRGLEVVHLDIDGLEAWSVGLRVGGRKLNPLLRRCNTLLEGKAAEALLVDERSQSYPEWLSSQVLPALAPSVDEAQVETSAGRGPGRRERPG